MELLEKTPKISRKLSLLGYWISFGGAALLGLVDVITNKIDLNIIILCVVAAIFFKSDL